MKTGKNLGYYIFSVGCISFMKILLLMETSIEIVWRLLLIFYLNASSLVLVQVL